MGLSTDEEKERLHYGATSYLKAFPWQNRRWLTRPKVYRKISMFIASCWGVWFLLSKTSLFGRIQLPIHQGSVAASNFQPFEISGYSIIGRPKNVSCESLLQNGTLYVKDGIHIYDDLLEIALSLDSHPMVVYNEGLRPQSINVTSIVRKSWARLSGSSAWLEQYGVYMVVSRVMFLNDGPLSAPIISFLRAQIYDEHWNHLNKYTIKWKDKLILFPLVYDVGAQWKEGDAFFGPEDPRIIIEQGVKDAEPVVVFNMITEHTDWNRAMWIFRPFSQHSTFLTVRGQERGNVEKNWSPFFLSTPVRNGRVFQKSPSQHLHLIYAYSPLRVLYCDLVTGGCDMAYSQENLHQGFKTEHSGDQNSLKGGTNLVPLPLQGIKSTEPIHAWVGLPRTHIDYGCNNYPVYRPMLVVLLNIGSQFYLTFASNSLDFGTAIIDPSVPTDGCGYGRILISNSITRWDHRGDRDVMTITVSVDDKSVQITEVTGILAFVRGLPWIQELLVEKDLSVGSENFLRNMEISAVGNDVQHCAVEAATNYTIEIEKKHLEIERQKKQKEKANIEIEKEEEVADLEVKEKAGQAENPEKLNESEGKENHVEESEGKMDAEQQDGPVEEEKEEKSDDNDKEKTTETKEEERDQEEEKGGGRGRGGEEKVAKKVEEKAGEKTEVESDSDEGHNPSPNEEDEGEKEEHKKEEMSKKDEEKIAEKKEEKIAEKEEEKNNGEEENRKKDMHKR